MVQLNINNKKSLSKKYLNSNITDSTFPERNLKLTPRTH